MCSGVKVGLEHTVARKKSRTDLSERIFELHDEAFSSITSSNFSSWVNDSKCICRECS